MNSSAPGEHFGVQSHAPPLQPHETAKQPSEQLDVPQSMAQPVGFGVLQAGAGGNCAQHLDPLQLAVQ